VIIEIDDRSLASIGRWPRDVLGRLVDRLRELGADTIAFNMILGGPETSRQFAAVGVGSVRQTPDELLAASLRSSKVVLGYGFMFQQPVTSAGSCELHPLDLSQLPTRGTVRSDRTPFFKATGALCPFRPLAVAAGRSGFLNGAADADGVFRRVPLVIEFDGRVYPSLAVATVATATSTRSAVLKVVNRSHESLTLGERIVPLDGKGNLLVRFRGQKRTLAYVSAADIMEGRALPNSIRNKIAFVGYTALGIRSLVRTPLDADFFDLEVQATVADNLLQGDFIHRAIHYEIVECLAVLILGITLTLIVGRFGLIAGGVAAVLEFVIVWAGAIWLLSVTGTLLSPFYPTTGLVLVFVILTLVRVRRESRRIGVAIRRIEDMILNR
jgi:adenylate cyclase